MAGVELRDLTLGYAGNAAVGVLDGVFAAGQATAVVGPNGSGKSTLLRGIAGLLTPMSGAIAMDGLTGREIAYMAQDDGVDRAFPISVVDMVALGFHPRIGLFGGLGDDRRRRLDDAITAAGLDGLQDRPIGALSGGQFQRTLFARVIAQDARLILLDEPFAMLDARTTADLTALVGRWVAEGRTIIMVLHDLELVRRLCAQTLVLAGGVVAWGPTEAVLSADHLARAQAMSMAAGGAA
jgi:zinc/manganese transport system ATP-binding protein